MEETAMSSPALDRLMACDSELDESSVMDIGIAYLNKKRKFQAELLDMNFPRHVYGDQVPEFDSSDFCIKKVKSSTYVGEHESNLNSSEDSYSFNGDAFTCLPDGTKVCVLFSKSPASIEPSTVSSGCDAILSEITHHSLDSHSLTKSCSSKSETLSISEEVDCCGLPPSDTCDEHIHEFGSCANCSCAECQIDGFEHCMGKELNALLCSDEMAPKNNYVLSSGRWSVDQDSKQETKKLTIDKEFEQYFSMLML